MYMLLFSSNLIEREREWGERESEFVFCVIKYFCLILEFGKVIYKFNVYEWVMYFYGILIGWDKLYDIKWKYVW